VTPLNIVMKLVQVNNQLGKIDDPGKTREDKVFLAYLKQVFDVR
jgi:hypothetical protein